MLTIIRRGRQSTSNAVSRLADTVPAALCIHHRCVPPSLVRPTNIPRRRQQRIFCSRTTLHTIQYLLRCRRTTDHQRVLRVRAIGLSLAAFTLGDPLTAKDRFSFRTRGPRTAFLGHRVEVSHSAIKSFGVTLPRSPMREVGPARDAYVEAGRVIQTSIS